MRPDFFSCNVGSADFTSVAMEPPWVSQASRNCSMVLCVPVATAAIVNQSNMLLIKFIFVCISVAAQMGKVLWQSGAHGYQKVTLHYKPYTRNLLGGKDPGQRLPLLG